MQHARGKLVRGKSGGATQKTSVLQIGLAPRPGPHRVADHATEAGVRSAVGVDRGRVVVGLDLEADVVTASSNRTTPALSAKTLTSQSGLRIWVAWKIVFLSEVGDHLVFEPDEAREASCANSVRSRSCSRVSELAVGRVAFELG